MTPTAYSESSEYGDASMANHLEQGKTINMDDNRCAVTRC